MLKNKNTEGLLYHGSLAVRNPVALAALQKVKARHQGKIFIDVNLRPPWWERETLLQLLQDADSVKLNETEMAELSPDYPGLEAAMPAFCEQFDLDTLVVTLGAKGAVACGRQGHLVAAKPPASAKVTRKK